MIHRNLCTHQALLRHTYLIFQGIKPFEDEFKHCLEVLGTWCCHKDVGIPARWQQVTTVNQHLIT